MEDGFGPADDIQDMVPDPVSEEVGFIGVMKEDGKPIEVAVRLKIRDGQITEAEHVIARNIRPASLANLRRRGPGCGHRASIGASAPSADDERHALLLHSDRYQQRQSGAVCRRLVRLRNGMQTTAISPGKAGGFGTMGAMGCSAQLDTE